MTSSPAPRRRRYERKKPEHPVTPPAAAVLRYVAECGVVLPSQLCRMLGTGPSGVGKHLRNLFDHGFVERVPVPIATLLPESARKDPSMMFTLGPDAYKPTQSGLNWLTQFDPAGEDWRKQRVPEFTSVNTYFLAHELLTRDIRAWLEICSRFHGGRCLEWRYGPDAHLATVRPDATFRYLLPSNVTFTGHVEADRGTERGDRWWMDKVAKYSALPETNEVEYVLVITLDASRRDRIARYAEGTTIAASFFCCVREDIYEGGMCKAVWRRPNKEGLYSLVPERHLVDVTGQSTNI